jgi:hypothetical protein
MNVSKHMIAILKKFVLEGVTARMNNGDIVMYDKSGVAIETAKADASSVVRLVVAKRLAINADGQITPTDLGVSTVSRSTSWIATANRRAEAWAKATECTELQGVSASNVAELRGKLLDDVIQLLNKIKALEEIYAQV